MKGNLRSAGLAICLLGAVAFAGQNPTLLRRQLKEGATEKYQVDMKMNTVVEMPGGLGEQELGLVSSAELDLKLGKMNWQIPGARVDAVMKVTKMEADGIMAGAFGDKVPPPMEVKATLDIFGRLRPVQTAESGFELGQMQSLSFSMMTVELPEKAVSIGDSWRVVVPKSTMTKKNQFLTATLKGERGNAWIVSLDGTYKLEMEPREIAASDGPANAMAGQKVAIKGDVTVAGEGLVEKSSGRTLSLKVKSTTKQVAKLAGMGLEINSSSVMDSSVTAK
ncbi:MAG: DUF6263 family protein [Fimbriimonas sp.]